MSSGRLVDRLAHLDRRPVVLLLPLDLAAERRGLLDDREDRHDRVEAELGVARRRQARHQLGLAVGVRERRVDQVHQLDRRDRGRVDHRGAVDRLPAQRGEHALAAGHRSRSRLPSSLLPGQLGATSTPRPAAASSSRRAARTLSARGSSSPTERVVAVRQGKNERRLVRVEDSSASLASPRPAAARRLAPSAAGPPVRR